MADHSSKVETVLRTLSEIFPTTIGSIFFNFIDHRSKLKQNRFNLFLESFMEFFEKHQGVRINEEFVRSEEFGDFFELMVRKVTETNSKEKLQRFKFILYNTMTSPESLDTDLLNRFSSLISELSDIQIVIMETLVYSHDGLNFKGIIKNLKSYSEKYPQMLDLKEMSDEHIYFYINDLASRGLIIRSITTPTQMGSSTVTFGITTNQTNESFKASPVADEFLEYINDQD